MICTVIFCLVFTAPAKWRVELRAKIYQYRNRCFHNFNLCHALRGVFNTRQTFVLSLCEIKRDFTLCSFWLEFSALLSTEVSSVLFALCRGCEFGLRMFTAILCHADICACFVLYSPRSNFGCSWQFLSFYLPLVNICIYLYIFHLQVTQTIKGSIYVLIIESGWNINLKKFPRRGENNGILPK